MSRRSAFTLVEVVISMTLFALLLSSLFFWYRHLTYQKGEVERIKRPLIEEHFAWQRLDQVLSKAEAPFFTDHEGVIFYFDRGVGSDPALSDTVIGKLHYDERLQILSLTIWPADPEEREPTQSFTLLDKVTEYSYQFYSPPPLDQKVVDPEQVGKPRPIVGWGNSTWNFDELPALVKLKIKRDTEEREMVFDLDHPILYPLMEGA